MLQTHNKTIKLESKSFAFFINLWQRYAIK